jgi:hypothetical protein
MSTPKKEEERADREVRCRFFEDSSGRKSIRIRIVVTDAARRSKKWHKTRRTLLKKTFAEVRLAIPGRRAYVSFRTESEQKKERGDL